MSIEHPTDHDPHYPVVHLETIGKVRWDTNLSRGGVFRDLSNTQNLLGYSTGISK